MNKFEEFNYYEILEIPVNASSFEIRRAYRNALEVYSDHSLLTYSLFSVEERVSILKKLEDAYNTLIDRTRRKMYDASLGDKSSNTNITAGTASKNSVTSQSISTETRAESSLISKDRGFQKSLHEKSVEIVDFRPARSFWGQISSKMVVITSLLGLTLIALSAILGPLDLLGKYFPLLPPDESHLEAKAKQAQVEESDVWERKDKVKEKPENLDDKTLNTPESISSTEDLPEVYENIATSANIRARPTIDSRIITRIPRGEEINAVGRDGEWTMLKLDDGSVAWIHRSLIRRRPTNTHSSKFPQ